MKPDTILDGFRYCSRCDTMKSELEFYKVKEGFKFCCKACYVLYQIKYNVLDKREYYRKNREKILLQQKMKREAAREDLS